jgi:hypothetical protein
MLFLALFPKPVDLLLWKYDQYYLHNLNLEKKLSISAPEGLTHEVLSPLTPRPPVSTLIRRA